MAVDEKELEKFVAPAYPEVFASGVIINGFTPLNDRSTDSLAEAARQFKVDVIIIVDYEMLANRLKNQLKDLPQIQIIQVPKSGGVQSVEYDEKSMHERYRDAFSAGGQLSITEIYQRLHVYEKYQEYFRGKHYLSFSKHDQAKLQELYGLDTGLSRNEFDP